MSSPQYHFQTPPEPKEGEVCPHGLYQDGFIIKCVYCSGQWRFDGSPMGALLLPDSRPWCVNSGDRICVVPRSSGP